MTSDSGRFNIGDQGFYFKLAGVAKEFVGNDSVIMSDIEGICPENMILNTREVKAIGLILSNEGLMDAMIGMIENITGENL